MTIAPDGTFTVEEIDAQGKSHKWSSPWSDGQEVSINGIENATMISNVQDHTEHDVIKIRGKTVQTDYVLSPDGRTSTATSKGADSQGRLIHSVQVYDKQ